MQLNKQRLLLQRPSIGYLVEENTLYNNNK